MKFSVCTASTPDWTPAEAVRHLASQGWDGIEWRITDQEPAATPGFWAGNRATWPLTGLEESLPEIARITRGAGLAFAAIGSYVQVHDHPDVERVLAATAALGAGRVRLRLPALGTGRYPSLFAGARTDLERAVERAGHHDVKILVELHHRTIMASASSAVRLLDGLDPSRVGVIHDAGNMLIEGHEDYLAGMEMLGPHLAHVHVKNGLFVGRRPEWVPMREGLADLPALFRALATVGYDGWVSAEDFSTRHPLAARTSDNLNYLRSLGNYA